MPYLYSDEQNQIREEVRRTLSGKADPATLRALLETTCQRPEDRGPCLQRRKRAAPPGP